jgi:uncharacterized membrane protein YgdD (TMEM256/DUF423 family)
MRLSWRPRTSKTQRFRSERLALAKLNLRFLDFARNDILVAMSILLFRIAAALCFLAVALGAFGVHSLKQTLETHGMLDVWNKAVFYHFIHALALLVLAIYGAANRSAWWLLLAGIIIFSGSLYVMALTNLRWLGAITPVGGLCFLAGWARLAIAPGK